jgi:CBS domain-containing protein
VTGVTVRLEDPVLDAVRIVAIGTLVACRSPRGQWGRGGRVEGGQPRPAGILSDRDIVARVAQTPDKIDQLLLIRCDHLAG